MRYLCGSRASNAVERRRGLGPPRLHDANAGRRKFPEVPLVLSLSAFVCSVRTLLVLEFVGPTSAAARLSFARSILEKMPRSVVEGELEVKFLELFCKITKASQGQMRSQQGKLCELASRLQAYARRELLLQDATFTGTLMKNKLDHIRKKAKKICSAPI